MITSKWLSQRLEKNIRDNPEIKLTNIQNRDGRKWNIGTMAYKNVEGSFREQYKIFYDYAQEILRSNLGSTVKVNVNDNEGQKMFKRLYVCLKASKDNFVSCRPSIGLDGCFLKGKYGRELLLVVARDGND